MFRFYNTTKTRGPGEDAPSLRQRQTWRAMAIGVFLLALLPFTSNAQVTNTTTSATFTDLASAITAATNGDVLQLTADLTLSSQVTINKQVTIDGSGYTISVSGTASSLSYQAGSNGSILKNVIITKTDDNVNQDIILVQENNLTFDNVDFSAQFNIGDGEVTRAFDVVGSYTGLLIENCSFSHIRQPGYINAGCGGQINNNFVDNTKGWVIVANCTISFMGNTWGTNVKDISFIADVPPVTTNNYPPSVIATIAANNNNPDIDNQWARVHNITQDTYFYAIQDAIDAANANDVIYAEAGVYDEAITIDKSLTLKGAQADVDPRPSTGSSRTIGGAGESIVTSAMNQNTIKIEANNVTINGFQFTQSGGSGTADAVKAAASQTGISVLNNIVLNATDEGIQLEAGVNYLIQKNYVKTSTGDGITISSYSGTTVGSQPGVNQIISQNEIEGSTSAAGSIYLYGTQNVDVSGNLITTKQSGIAIGSGGLPVSNVIVSNNQINTEMHTAFSAYAVGIGIDDISNNIQILNNVINDIGDGDLTHSNAYPDRFGLIYIGPGPANPSNVVIKNNSLYRFVKKNYIYIKNSVTNNVVATCNWYGNKGYAHVKSYVNDAGHVADFLPYLNDGTDNNGATIGFAPVANTCFTPMPNVSGTLDTFKAIFNHNSTAQSLTIVGGSDFIADKIHVEADNGFEVSADNSTFGSSADVDTANGTLVYIRYNATGINANNVPYTGTLKFSSPEVDTYSVAAYGLVSLDTVHLDVAALALQNKVYDGNADAIITGGFALTTSATGVSLDTSAVTALFDNKNVGTGKTVTVSGFALAGANAANYYLADTPVVFTTGEITKKAATITATNQVKCYNVAFTGVADSTHFTDTGFVAGEGVVTVDLTSTGSGSLAAAGNYPIVPSNAVGDSATDVNNYNITYVNGVLKALPKLAVYINTVANQSVCAGNSISLNYTLEGPGVLSADLLISKVDGLVTPFDTFHIDNKIAGSSQSVTIPDSLTPNTGNTDVKYRLTWLNVTSDSINCDGITNGQVDVTIHPAPALAVSYTDTTICSGNDWTVGLSNPNAVTGATYKIVANYGAATGNIPAAGVTNNFGVSSYTDHLVNNSGAPVVVTYTITSKSPSPDNCDGAYEIVSITVNPNPVLATVVADSVCEGEMTTITLSGLDPNGVYDIEGAINGNFDNNGTNGSFSLPGLTGNITADGSGNYSFVYPTVFGDSVVTDYTAQVTKLTYSATGCFVDYTDSNKIGTGVVHPLPTDHLWIDGMALSNNGTKEVCEGSVVTVSTHGDSANTYTLYRGDHSTVVATGNVGDSTYSFTARLSDNGQYFLHVESPFGCSAEDTITLGVNPLPVATLMADGSALNNGDTLVVCEATPVTLELTGTLSTDSYVLLQGTDTVATGHVNDAAFTFPAGLSDAGTYYLHVMNSDGCGTVDTFNLIVNPLPTDVFAINGTTVGTINVQSGDTASACATSPLTFTVTGNATDSFVLYRGSTLVYSGHPGAPAYSFNAATANAGTYYLTMMNVHGCSVADTFVLKVNPLPQAAFVVNGFAAHNGDTLANCEGTPMALTLTGNASDSYVLLHGTDTVGVGHPNDPAYNFTAALSDAGMYYLYLSNAFGCGTVDTFNFVVHPLPADVFAVNGAAVTNGDTVTFCENSPVSLTLNSLITDSFALYHGATLVGSGMSNGPAYNFNASASYDAGTYYMHLISEYGCETVDTIEMVVNPLPSATFTFNTNPLMNGDTAIACVESPVTLELTGDATDSYVLLHGTDTVATGNPNDPAFTFDAAMSDAGTYYLHLTSQHGCGIVDTFNLNVVALPAFAWSFNGFPATANDSATAINYCASDTLALGLNIDSNYTFTIALDGSMSPAMPGVDTTVAVPLSFVTPGIHALKLTATNQNGCDSSMTVFINVHGLPTFVANTVTNVHCHGGTDGSFAFVVLNNDSTTANYTFNIINVNGNDTVYTLNVNSLAPTSPIIVAGTQSNLGAGTYQVVVSNSFGCATIDTVTISEPPALSLAMTSQDVTCGAVTPNGKIQIQPTGGTPFAGNYYSLTISGPGYNNAQYTAPGTSVYTVNNLGAGVYTLTLTDDNGCSISQTDTIMQPSANVVTSVNGPDTVNMNASASVILSATGAALPVTYTYTVNGGTPQTATSSASSADVTLTVPTNTVGSVAYAITAVTDANGAPCSPVLGSGTVEVVNQAVVDLRPAIDLTSNSLTIQYNSTSGSVALLNLGNTASSGQITVLVSKPSSSINLDFSAATDWTVTQIGSFYKLTSNTIVPGNNGFAIIPFTATLSSAGQPGSYLINVSVINGSGGDNNANNNGITSAINVSQ